MNLSDPIFSDETAARAYFETIRWPNGPECPHCGEKRRVYRLTGDSHRPGLIHCNGCQGSFTVTTGGVMESSHVPLTKWALAFRLFAASKKGVSAAQLGRMIGVTYKTAWFMAHRVREAMGPSGGELGGVGRVVEADEHFTGRRPGWPVKTGGQTHKMAVVTVVERGGRARSVHVQTTDGETVSGVVMANVVPGSELHTDQSQKYSAAGAVTKRKTVNHGRKEYRRGDVTTNSVEGYFSVFERGMVGVYQHVSEKHLQRYLNEFDFRQSNRVAVGVDDDLRTERMVKAAEGKRLTYRVSRDSVAALVKG